MAAIAKTPFRTIEEYIASFPPETQVVLDGVRQTIRGVVPEAQEAIRYNMPTFLLDGASLVHFAGWKRHIGLYPMPAETADQAGNNDRDGKADATTGEEAMQADRAAERELAAYRTPKGTGQFPLREPFRYDLVARAVTELLRQRRGGQRG